MNNAEIYFDIVSQQQFLNDAAKHLQYNLDDAPTLSRLMMAYDMFVEKPKRATVGSCGYDFVAPVSFALEPNQKLVIPTGIRVKMPEYVYLMIVPRSSLGMKYRIGLANTVGIIDSDYYGAENQGHIMIALENRGDAQVLIEAGDRFAQGIFMSRLLTVDDDVKAIRDGGMGSTGR